MQGRYCQLEPDVFLHYYDQGAGTPLLFLPGWSVPKEVFVHQIEAFSRSYRVIAVDPRGQGKSSRCADGNDFAQRAVDLETFMDKLGLERVVLCAWSMGGHNLLAWVRRFGTARLQAAVLIDSNVEAVRTADNDWARADLYGWGRFIQAFTHDRHAFLASFVRSMFEGEAPAEVLDLVRESALQTPVAPAIQMIAECMTGDYREEFHQLLQTVPCFLFIRASAREEAEDWLRAYPVRDDAVRYLGEHMMFYEYPDTFNRELAGFLLGL